MSEILRILVIDDNPDDRLLAIRELRREFPDLQMEQISEAKGLAQALEAGDFDLVITDYQLRWTDGLAVLRAIRGVNQLIVREKDRGRLIQGACDRLIETRGYYNAWIVLRDESDKLVATAEAGLGERFLPLVEQLERGEPSYCTRMALAQAGALIIEDPFSTCTDCPLSRAYRGRGGMAIRLEHGGKTYGLLVVSLSVDHVADREEQSLFEEVAEDIAFALHSIGLEEERERAQEALREKTEQQEVLLSSIPASVCYKDAELKLITANRAFAEMVNTPIDQLPGKDAYDLFPKEQAEKFHIDDKEVMESGKPMMNIEEQYTDAEGETGWASTSKTPYFDEKGKVAGMVGITMDITERKRAEEALRESEEKHRTLFETMVQGVVYQAADGAITSANPAAERILGLTLDQMQGRTSVDPRWRAVHEDGSDFPGETHASMVALKTGKEVRNVVMGVFNPQYDEYRWIDVNAVPQFRPGENTPYQVYTTFDDITERKRAEEELRQSYVQLQRTLEGTVNTLVSTIEMRDPYTAGHQRRVTQLACAIANEMGLPQEQSEGIRMAGLIHDLGKITIPAEVLSKPIQLNDFEWGMIKMHPRVGYDVLKEIEFPWPLAPIVLQHHERMDGSGYPRGLSGEDILMEARILAVADVVEAMASRRPYRPALGIDKALDEISQNRGVLYDSEVVDVCLRLFTEKGFAFE